MSKYEQLKHDLRERSEGGIALAFSGGVDSSLLLAVLKELHDEAPFPLLALTLHSIFQRPEELDEVRKTAGKAGIELKLFGCDPLSIPEVKYNPPDRCFWCKRYLFSEIRDFAAARGIGTVIDGTNADDRKSYRPGLAALEELGILSPLAELGITKAEVRRIAAELHLECAEKPSVPCMATRFEYGSLLTEDLIRKAIDGEDLVRKLVPSVHDVRLRIHAGIARIEVSGKDIAATAARHREIAEGLKQLGFHFVTLDLEGFRSGSMDDLNNRQSNKEA